MGLQPMMPVNGTSRAHVYFNSQISQQFPRFGLPVLLDSFARFRDPGATPAPVASPQHLVVTGLYRYVRNPMYVAVLSLIFGQGLLFGSGRLLEYGLIVWLGICLLLFFSMKSPHFGGNLGKNMRPRPPLGSPPETA
ncbi:MAG: methyltransferase [Candidatus Korobacteraceae bacterium]